MIDKNYIKVKDLYFVFNTRKTAWIAVTPDALEFCNRYIEDKASIEVNALNDDEKLLMKGLDELVEANNEYDETDEYKSCYIHVTQSCNLQCPYCYSKNEMRNAFKDFSLDQWQLAIRKIREMGFHRLVFSGGEPLLFKHIDKLLYYCKELKFEEIDLITNGLLIDERNIVALKDNVDNLCISLDGFNEETNSPTRGKGNFEKVVKNIRILREKNIPVNIIATIYKNNIENINEYLSLAELLDCTVSFSLFTISGEALNNKELQQTEVQLSELSNYLLDDDVPSKMFDNIPLVKGIQFRNGCGAGKYLISVNADGNIYPCHFMMQEELLIGNIFKNSIDEILNMGSLHSSYMQVDNIDECRECEYKYLCGGGCRANTYKGKGNIRCSDDCKFYKVYYDKIIGEFM